MMLIIYGLFHTEVFLIWWFTSDNQRAAQYLSYMDEYFMTAPTP